MPIFVANMTASLLIGLVAGTISRGVHVSPRSRLFLMTGFLGGLSSFSSLVLGTDQMLADPTQRLTAVAYLLGSMVIGLGLTIAGIRLGRRQNVAARRP